ncbi:hypothetical protein TNCV_3820451 [Trichonephila clavipes]|nr:hypothetical protein TNCV_3820451 [Trichonephila clavipes]
MYLYQYKNLKRFLVPSTCLGGDPQMIGTLPEAVATTGELPIYAGVDAPARLTAHQKLCCGGADFLQRQQRYSPRKVMKFGEYNTCSEDAEGSSLELQVPVTPSPSPQ